MFSAGAPVAATRTSPFAVLPMGLKTVLHRRFESGTGSTRVAVLPGIDPAVARAEADRLAPADRYGPGLTGGPVTEGRSATALWAGPPAVLADYDPIRGTLGICAFARESEPSAPL